MKNLKIKFVRIIAVLLMLITTTMLVTACSETGGPSASAVAIGVGHKGSNDRFPTVIEATVILGGGGVVKKVQFDEIFSPEYSSYVKDEAAGRTTKANNKHYYNYLSIDGRIFEFFEDIKTENDTSVRYPAYREIGENATINNLFEYYGSDLAAMEWYYNSVINKKAFYAVKNEDGTISATTSALTTTYGSIRKRYSTYWSASSTMSQSALGIKGNMEALENYLLEYGFDGISDSGNIIKPSADSPYVLITGSNGNTITTGATATDAHLYLQIAKNAYDSARAKQTG